MGDSVCADVWQRGRSILCTRHTAQYIVSLHKPTTL
jgi:hypothetical protein